MAVTADQDRDERMEEIENPNELPYDPDQNREERRAIRKGYRQLQEDESLQNPSEVGIDTLTEKVEIANSLFARVKGPQEATLDSAFLLTASNLSAAKARQMKSTLGGFDIDDFVAKLITFMGGRRAREDIPKDAESSDAEPDEDGDVPLEWEKIGRRALAKSRRVPAIDFMLGPLNIEHKKRIVQKRARLEKDKYEEKRPQQLKEEDIERSENETTKNVAALEKLLAKSGRINLFKFIVNPGDFGQTVENMFYLSFLIRDAKCALEMDENDEPIIFLSEPPSETDYVEYDLKKNQMVMELDMDTWRRAIEVFDIQEPKIPTRKPAPTTFIRQRQPAAE